MANTAEASPLYGDPLQHVLRFLDPRSLCAVCQVSRGWLAAGSHQDLWRSLAAQKWPEETLRLYPFYTTYKELFQDDNKCSACPTIDLASMNKLSAYKYNRPSYFLECRLIALQWDRYAQLVSLYFDARGDLDSRRPNSSCAAVVVDRPSYNYHVAERMQPNMSDLIQTSQAKHCSLWDSTPRHSRGCLIWHEQELFESPSPQVGSPYKLCDTSNHGQHPKLKDNKALVFCFANAVVSDHLYLDADCTCAELLKIPAHCHYKDAFMTQCTSFELPCAEAEMFKSYVEG